MYCDILDNPTYSNTPAPFTKVTKMMWNQFQWSFKVTNISQSRPGVIEIEGAVTASSNSRSKKASNCTRIKLHTYSKGYITSFCSGFNTLQLNMTYLYPSIFFHKIVRILYSQVVAWLHHFLDLDSLPMSPESCWTFLGRDFAPKIGKVNFSEKF